MKKGFRSMLIPFFGFFERVGGTIHGFRGGWAGIVPPEMGLNVRVLGRFLAFFGKK